jgi:hypothetical protein
VSSPTPDYCEAISGWRIWEVLERAGRARLSSPMYFEQWEPLAEFVAECNVHQRERFRPWRLTRTGHAAPADGCTCGVYAIAQPRELGHFFRWTVAGPRVHYHVFGRVSLWGDVIESSDGWRASHAYPAELWLPEMDYHIEKGLGMARAVDGLAEYGVPLHVCEHTGPRDVIAGLGSTEPATTYA